LRGENIYIAKFIHWNNGTIPTQLRDKTIVRMTWLIIKGEIELGKQKGTTPTALFSLIANSPG